MPPSLNHTRRAKSFFCSVLLVLAAALLAISPAKASLFADVPPSSSSFVAVTALLERGVVSAAEEFFPNRPVNRAEAAKMVALAAGIPVLGGGASFPDVPLDSWFAAPVQALARAGVVRGDAAGNFLPNAEVTRAELLVMLFRAEGSANILESPSSPPFADIPIDAWFAPAFAEAKRRGWLPEANELAQPAQPLNRAEVAQLIFLAFGTDWQVTELRGEASFYGDAFAGRTTASGTIFSPDAYTAAHKTLPFGTRVLVRHEETREGVVVDITDRGPFIAGRVIDLSERAFADISPLSRGVFPATIRVVSASTPLGPQSCPLPADLAESDALPINTFTGVTLDSPLPKSVAAGQVLRLTGTVAAGESYVRFFRQDEQGAEVFLNFAADQNGRFSAEVVLPKPLGYEISLAPFSAKKLPLRRVVATDSSCIPLVKTPAEPAPAAPDNIRATWTDGLSGLRWTGGPDDASRALFLIEVSAAFVPTGKATPAPVQLLVSGRREALLPAEMFTEFVDFNMVNVQIFAANGSGADAQRRFSRWSASKKISFPIVPHRAPLRFTPATSSVANNVLTVRGTKPADRGIWSHAVVVRGEENFESLPLSKASDGSFSFSVPLAETDLTEIEILDDGRSLAFLVGAPPAGALSVIPDFFSLAFSASVESAISPSQEFFRQQVNRHRRSFGLSPLALEENLQKLAQFRADTICAEEIFGHVDGSGKRVEDYRELFGVRTTVSENLALERGPLAADQGLYASPVHRRTLLASNNAQVGFGWCQPQASDAEFVLVQLFSAEAFQPEQASEWEERFLAQANETRTSSGLGALRPDTRLSSVAQSFADVMAAREELVFTAGGQSLNEFISNSGYRNAVHATAFQVGTPQAILSEVPNQSISLGSSQHENLFLKSSGRTLGVGFGLSASGDVFMLVLVGE